MPIRGMNGHGDNALVFESQREDGVQFAQECKSLSVLVALADQATVGLPAAGDGGNHDGYLDAAEQGGGVRPPVQPAPALEAVHAVIFAGRGPAGRRLSGRTFLTSIKAALNGPHAPPPGRASVASLTLRLRPRNTPGGWRGSVKPKGPPQNDRSVDGVVVGRQPAGPRGHEPARRREAHAGRVGELAAVAGCGYCASGGGARAPRWLQPRRRVAVRGWLRGPSRLPSTRASRADHRPTRQRATVRQGRLDVAGRAAARSPGGRVDGRRDGNTAGGCCRRLKQSGCAVVHGGVLVGGAAAAAGSVAAALAVLLAGTTLDGWIMDRAEA